MATYDNDEATSMFSEQVLSATEVVMEADLVRLDMLGYFAWNIIHQDSSSEEEKQKALLGALLAAVYYGTVLEQPVDIPEEYADFMETLEIDEPEVKRVRDLMGW
jgi:hypothetical protein